MKTAGIGVLAWVGAILLITGTAMWFMLIQPWFLERERINVESSRQYQTTQRQGRNTLQADYDTNEVRIAELRKTQGNEAIISALEAQQAGIQRQIQQLGGSK